MNGAKSIGTHDFPCPGRCDKKSAVQTLPATIYGQADPFGSTHWSVIAAAGDSSSDSQASGVALAQLCETYWPPLYTYVRARGYPRHDAQDLTQAFFAHLIERRIYTRTDRRKGKFRAFLLAALKNFLSDARDREQALKRGGGCDFLPLDEAKAEAAESWLTRQGLPDSAGDHLFERNWAETLVRTALERVAESYRTEGKQSLFDSLRVFLTIGAAPLPTYAELATRLAIAESTLRSHVTRLRARYRAELRAEVRRTVNTDAQVDAELRELLHALSA